MGNVLAILRAEFLLEHYDQAPAEKIAQKLSELLPDGCSAEVVPPDGILIKGAGAIRKGKLDAAVKEAVKSLFGEKPDKVFESFTSEEGEEGATSLPQTEDAPARKRSDVVLDGIEEALGASAGKEGAPQEEKKEEETPSTKPLIAGYRRAVDLADALNAKVMGQRHAVSAFSEGIFGITLLSEGEKGKRKGPLGTFLFAGPPGVGKTYLSELSAEILGLPFLRVDMSEFSDNEGGNSFNGVHASYKNAHPGIVTGFVKKNPHSILLFDEVEKAHENVLYLFLQILEGGRLRDMFLDEEISFTDTIIIMTTNAGRNLYEDDRRNLACVSSKTVLAALKSDINPLTGSPFFPAPIVSRMSSGTVVMFNHLEPYALRDIVVADLNARFGSIEARSTVKFEADEDVASALLYSQGGSPDARTLRGAAVSFLRREVLDLFRQYEDAAALEALKKVTVRVDRSDATEEAAALFGGKKPTILLFCDEARFAALPKAKWVDMVRVSDPGEAKRLTRDEPSCVFVDVTCGLREKQYSPSDLEDLDSDGMDFFRYLREFEDELPVYVLDPFGKGEGRFLSFIREGARDSVPCAEGKENVFLERLREIALNARMSASCHLLSHSGKVLSYNCVQLIHPEKGEAEILISRLALKRAIAAEDSESVLGDTMRPNVRFSDVIGAKEAKEALMEFAGYLKDPASCRANGFGMPKGVLLYGAPGVGKTLLAKALAGESDVAFIQKNATEFLQKYVGVGPQMIRDLFRTARRYAPAVIFIDEVDAIARARTGGNGHVGEDVLNALLSELDGFIVDEKHPVFLLAATNFEIEGDGPRVLDPAFVRRFDRKLRLELPDTEERAQFLKYYLAKRGVSDFPEEALSNIAARTYGKSPADLEMIVQFAFRTARGAALTPAILGAALDRYNYGEEHVWKKEVVERTAWHEAGHALLYWIFGEKPQYITIISRSSYGGYVLNVDDERFGYTRGELLNRIASALGGRAAELLIYGSEGGLTTGPSQDLVSATSIAQKIIASYGMNDGKLVSFAPGKLEPGTALYNEINEILTAELARALKLLRLNRTALGALQSALMERNSLTGEELAEVLGEYSPVTEENIESAPQGNVKDESNGNNPSGIENNRRKPE